MNNFSLVGQTGANVGQIDGDLSKGVAKSYVIFGGKLSAANMADATSITTALKGYALLTKTDSNKLLWLPEIQDIADKSDADKEGTLNQGFKTILVEGKTSFTVKMFGSSEFNKNIRKFNGKIIRIMEYDSNGKLWGAQSGTDLVGYQAKIHVKGQRAATGQNVEEGVIEMNVTFLSTTECYDAPKAVDLSSVDITSIDTQVDAQLVKVSNTSNAYKIALQIPTGIANQPYDVSDKYTSELAQASLWVAGTGLKYATSLAITSVTYSAADKAWIVTFDTTAYGGLTTGAAIQLKLVAPTALNTAGVIGIEGVPVVIVK